MAAAEKASVWWVGAIVLGAIAVIAAARLTRPLPPAPARDRALMMPPTSFAHLPAGHIEVRAGPDAPVVTLAEGADGEPITAACSTCHASRDPNINASAGEMPATFHTELRFSHGDLTCLSCHNANDYDALYLAGGRRLEYRDVMNLCAQCHGGRARDYENGAHGGMVGYWDLSRGGQLRNNCVDCHDPHNPAFPPMMPTFRPIDRFLTPTEHEPEGSH